VLKGTNSLLSVAVMFALLALSCDNESTRERPRGTEGGPCYDDDTCDGNLVCFEGMCFAPGAVSDKDALADDAAIPDIDHGTGTPGEMVDVPAGEFWMGCNEEIEGPCQVSEYPYHAVTLSAYRIGRYEVTVGEYQKCIVSGACTNAGKDDHYYTFTESSFCNIGTTGKDDHPANCVTWNGANAYCAWVGGRLPTEAEWEKAARGTDGWRCPWGNAGVSCYYAVMDDENSGSEGCGTGGTLPVGSRPEGVSPYGAYDMIGNVTEWVADWFGEDYYASSPATDPPGPETGEWRVVRGGAWLDVDGKLVGYDEPLRASDRGAAYPGNFSLDIFPDPLRDAVGFRCAE